MSTIEIDETILNYNRAASQGRRIAIATGLAATVLSARYLQSSEKIGIKQVVASFVLYLRAGVATLAAYDEYDYLKYGPHLPPLEPFGTLVTEIKGEGIIDEVMDDDMNIIINRHYENPTQLSDDLGFQGPRGH